MGPKRMTKRRMLSFPMPRTKSLLGTINKKFLEFELLHFGLGIRKPAMGARQVRKSSQHRRPSEEMEAKGAKLENFFWINKSGYKIESYKINALIQFIDEIRCLGIKSYPGSLCKMLKLFLRDKRFRRYVKNSWPSRKVRGYFSFLGYVLLVIKK